MRKVKLLIASLGLLLCLAPATPAAAQVYDPFKKTCENATAKASPICKTDGSDPISGKNGILYKTSRILATVAAIGAVIMVIVGGFMYITASGDSSKANNGKRVIIGAIAGLVVIALAELFITIVINLAS